MITVQQVSSEDPKLSLPTSMGGGRTYSPPYLCGSVGMPRFAVAGQFVRSFDPPIHDFFRGGTVVSVIRLSRFVSDVR